MILSPKYRFLFIHIPKTGGTSLSRSLHRYARFSERVAYQGATIPGVAHLLSAVTGGQTIEKLTGLHAHASLSMIRKALGPDYVDGLFSFAVTRNPFTRAVSFYHHCQRDPNHPEHDIAMRHEFSDFVRFELDRHARSKPPAMRFTQRQYVWDPDTKETVVNALLAQERLAQDVRELEPMLKLPAALEPGLHNQAQSAPISIEALFGDTVSDFVAVLDDEFERFGYSTDISRAHEPPSRHGILVNAYAPSEGS